MIEHDLDIATAHGLMNTFITHPEEGGPFPVICFYMDAPGKREELHDMARRLATVGYYVILPNLYYRRTREFNLINGTQGETREQMFEHMHALTDEMVISDTEALFAHIDADPAALAGKVGCVGYCMSGPFVVAVAATFPDRVVAAASIYGVRLFGDGSPAHLLGQVAGELYFACAETDVYAPAETVDALEAHLASLDVAARVERYPGTEHGFAFPLRPVFDKAAAERHWERLFALFGRNLRRVD